MNYKETDDIWRLYRREWVIVHTLTAKGEDATEVVSAGHEWAKTNLYGRVRKADINLTANTDGTGMFWVHVQVFKDNLKGEFKYIQDAQFFAKTHDYDEFVIVPRNSKSDHDIRNYGVVRL